MSRTDGRIVFLWGNSPAPKKENGYTYKYADLRAKKNPSFSDLLEKRAISLANKRDQYNRREQNFHHSSVLSLMLAEWDPQHATTTMELVLQLGISISSDPYSDQLAQSGGTIMQMAKLANALAALDDFQGLEMYCAWLGTKKLEKILENNSRALFPLGLYPNNLAVREASIKLFENGGHAWVANRQPPSLLRTRLVCNPVFLESVVEGLTNQTRLGEFIVEKNNQYTVKTDFNTGGGMISLDTFAPTPGTTIPLRLCDEIARNLNRIQGLPPFQPYWPLEKRDGAIQDIITFLKSNIDHFVFKSAQAFDFDEE